MPIHSVCTGCGQSLTVGDEHAGKRARCPSCGQIYTVPLSSTTAAPNSPIGQLVSNPTPTAATGSPSGDIWGSTPTGNASSPSLFGETSAPPSQYWMRAADGSVYGPVDRANLDRWFKEGRVGVGYQIREGEQGSWLEASRYQPQAAANPYAPANPYTAAPSASPYAPPSGGSLHHYPKPDRGVLVLIMGILSWVICLFFGIVAVVVGRSALADIESGQANPNDKTLVKIGYWLGLISLILNVLMIGLFVLIAALAAITGPR